MTGTRQLASLHLGALVIAGLALVISACEPKPVAPPPERRDAASKATAGDEAEREGLGRLVEFLDSLEEKPI